MCLSLPACLLLLPYLAWAALATLLAVYSVLGGEVVSGMLTLVFFAAVALSL